MICKDLLRFGSTCDKSVLPVYLYTNQQIENESSSAPPTTRSICTSDSIRELAPDDSISNADSDCDEKISSLLIPVLMNPGHEFKLITTTHLDFLMTQI